MKMRTTIARTGLSARLAVIGCSAMTILASAAVSACTGSTPSSVPTSFSPAGSTSPTSASSSSSSASASASPSPTPSPSASLVPAAAPAAGGGGTAGFQDTLLFALGGAAVLVGAASIAYRRRLIRKRL